MVEDNKQKIPCGGFYIGEGLELDDTTKTLRSVGGGGLSLVSGEGINITWDGSTEGRDVISVEAVGINLYKVSNSVFDKSELIDSLLSYTIFGQGATVTLDENTITEIGTNCYTVNEMILISGVAGEYSIGSEGETANFTIPSDGTYFVSWSTPNGDVIATSLTKTGTAKLMQNGEDVTQEVAKTVGGGGLPFVVVHSDYDEEIGYQIYTNSSFADIVEALNTHKPCLFFFMGNEGHPTQVVFGVAEYYGDNEFYDEQLRNSIVMYWDDSASAGLIWHADGTVTDYSE